MLIGFLTTTFDIQSVRASDSGYAEFKDLSYHGLGSLFSSLTVSGTIDVYDDYNLSPSANTTTFTNTSITDLANSPRGASGNWDNAIKSLRVNGTVTLYERPDFAGKTATFTSDQPSDIVGTEWNANPNLNQTESSWDSRIWNASLDALQIPSENDQNSVLWRSDGHVESYAQDNASDSWKIVSFDQGYERNENEVPKLADWNAWDNKAESLIVEGSVTAFNGTNFAGENRTFSSSVPDLAIDGWNDTISSLKLAQGSRITLFENTNFTGRSESFVSPTYQPAELKVSDANTITLEGLIHDWYTDPWSWTTWGWTGAKFEVTASENRSSSSDKVLKIGMYFLRGGANLALQWWDLAHGANALVNWQGSDKEGYYNVGNTYNYMIALEAFPDSAQRTVYLGDIAKWKVDVKTLIQKACFHWSSDLDINKLSITKFSYTLEAARNLEDFDPKINCSLSQLRLTYTPAPSTRVYVEPYAVQNEAFVPGTTFNVSVKIDNIPATPGLIGIAFKLSWNSTLLNAVSMEEAIYHEVMPQAEIDNLWRIKHTVSNNAVDYAYTFQDLNRALTGGYAPINGSHTIARITLRVMDTGKCALHFDSVKLGDPQAHVILYQLSDGSFDNLHPEGAIIFVEPARIANASLGPGSNFTIDIRITNASGVAGVEFKLDFNPAALEAFNVTSGGFIPPTVTPFIQVNGTGGYIIFSLASNTALEENGTIVTIEFTVLRSGLLNTPLQLSHVRVTDNTDQELPFLKTDGSFSNIELVGDLNFDGTVDIFDAILLAGAFGSTRGRPSYKPEADINNDGIVDIYDALLLAGNFGKSTH